MGEAKRRKEALAKGLPDPGPSAPTPLSPRQWSDDKALAASVLAASLQPPNGTPVVPAHLQPLAAWLAKMAKKQKAQQLRNVPPKHTMSSDLLASVDPRPTTEEPEYDKLVIIDDPMP